MACVRTGHSVTETSLVEVCGTRITDKNISRQEIDTIYANLKGEKTLSTYPLIGHENYFPKYKAEWLRDVNSFLQKN